PVHLARSASRISAAAENRLAAADGFEVWRAVKNASTDSTRFVCVSRRDVPSCATCIGRLPVDGAKSGFRIAPAVPTHATKVTNSRELDRKAISFCQLGCYSLGRPARWG